MIGKFAQNNKVVLALPPVADAFATATQSDVVRADGCDSIVFIVATGVAVDNVNIITVQACPDVTPTLGTDIVFTVSSVISGDTNDSPVQTATTGKAFTATTANQYYIVEVDPADIEAAASHAGRGYVALTVTEAGTATAQVGCMIAMRIGEHKAQAVLPTAIT